MLRGRYEVLRTIGHGGMGAVYQAQDLRKRTICAIKEMSYASLPPQEREQAVQNFRAEAKMLSALKHPNLPTFTDFFNEDGRYFLVMEYVDGLTLDEMLEQNNAPFPERRVLGWARQLCDVLDFLHAQNPPIIFRDMKPGNIMLARNGRIKLIDFGIARIFRHAGSQDTQLLGTPGFAPPEQYGKAQTDERSDIYSLAITLFQLMTNTLPDQGFGLQDVQAINPHISLPVARALEKAAALSPNERFQSVEAFRRALLGEGTFLFENGEQATSPGELAELCALYPEEAANYLFNGEIESWLLEIGEPGLARTARHIRASEKGPGPLPQEVAEETIERFLQAVMGPNAHIRRYSVTAGSSSQQNHRTPLPRSGANASPTNWRWLNRNRATTVVAQPRSIDFGQMYPGISAPMSFSISGYRGAYVRGTITTSEPWIVVDRTSFDGLNTRVHVRAHSARLPGGGQHTGSILLTLEAESQPAAEVKVSVDLLEYAPSTPLPPSSAQNGQSGNTNNMTMSRTSSGAQTAYAGGTRMASQANAPKNTASTSTILTSQTITARYNEQRAKYGQPGGNSKKTGSSGWDPLQLSPAQLQWFQRCLSFFGSFMVIALFYSLFSRLPMFAHHAPLPPNTWFIVVLCCIIPLATLGALAVSWTSAWSSGKLLNRACTSLYTAFLFVGLGQALWQNLIQSNLPVLQLFIMFLLAAFGATLGALPKPSLQILKWTTWLMSRWHKVMRVVIVVVGGLLGYALVSGLTLSFFTPIGVLLGIAVALALLLRVQQLMATKTP